jgi:hypothetical protein
MTVFCCCTIDCAPQQTRINETFDIPDGFPEPNSATWPTASGLLVDCFGVYGGRANSQPPADWVAADHTLYLASFHWYGYRTIDNTSIAGAVLRQLPGALPFTVTGLSTDAITNASAAISSGPGFIPSSFPPANFGVYTALSKQLHSIGWVSMFNGNGTSFTSYAANFLYHADANSDGVEFVVSNAIYVCPLYMANADARSVTDELYFLGPYVADSSGSVAHTTTDHSCIAAFQELCLCPQSASVKRDFSLSVKFGWDAPPDMPQVRVGNTGVGTGVSPWSTTEPLGYPLRSLLVQLGWAQLYLYSTDLYSEAYNSSIPTTLAFLNFVDGDLKQEVFEGDTLYGYDKSFDFVKAYPSRDISNIAALRHVDISGLLNPTTENTLTITFLQNDDDTLSLSYPSWMSNSYPDFESFVNLDPSNIYYGWSTEKWLRWFFRYRLNRYERSENVVLPFPSNGDYLDSLPAPFQWRRRFYKFYVRLNDTVIFSHADVNSFGTGLAYLLDYGYTPVILEGSGSLHIYPKDGDPDPVSPRIRLRIQQAAQFVSPDYNLTEFPIAYMVHLNPDNTFTRNFKRFGPDGGYFEGGTGSFTGTLSTPVLAPTVPFTAKRSQPGTVNAVDGEMSGDLVNGRNIPAFSTGWNCWLSEVTFRNSCVDGPIAEDGSGSTLPDPNTTIESSDLLVCPGGQALEKKIDISGPLACLGVASGSYGPTHCRSTGNSVEAVLPDGSVAIVTVGKSNGQITVFAVIVPADGYGAAHGLPTSNLESFLNASGKYELLNASGLRTGITKWAYSVYDDNSASYTAAAVLSPDDPAADPKMGGIGWPICDPPWSATVHCPSLPTCPCNANTVILTITGVEGLTGLNGEWHLDYIPADGADWNDSPCNVTGSFWHILTRHPSFSGDSRVCYYRHTGAFLTITARVEQLLTGGAANVAWELRYDDTGSGGSNNFTAFWWSGEQRHNRGDDVVVIDAEYFDDNIACGASATHAVTVGCGSSPGITNSVGSLHAPCLGYCPAGDNDPYITHYTGISATLELP